MRKTVQNSRVRPPAERKESSVSATEENRTFRVVVPGGRQPDKVHIDAPPFVSRLKSRCDYAIEVFADKPKKAFFFVELKGEDVHKAIKQLAYTAEHLADYRDLLDYRQFAVRHACIVASRGPQPSITMGYQKCKTKIERCGFAKVVCRTHQLTARVATNGEVRYE